MYGGWKQLLMLWIGLIENLKRHQEVFVCNTKSFWGWHDFVIFSISLKSCVSIFLIKKKIDQGKRIWGTCIVCHWNNWRMWRLGIISQLECGKEYKKCKTIYIYILKRNVRVGWLVASLEEPAFSLNCIALFSASLSCGWLDENSWFCLICFLTIKSIKRFSIMSSVPFRSLMVYGFCYN